MKKLLILLAAYATAATASHAQAPAPQTTPPTAGPQKATDPLITRRVEYLAKELGLNADQQARLHPMLLTQRQQMQVLREQRTTGGRRQGTAQDLRVTQTRFDEQLKTVLTPEQFAKFAAMKDEQRDKMRERRAAAPGQATAQPE